MFNTIFRKMLIFSLLISVGSLACTSLFISYLLEKRVYETTRDRLAEKAEELNEVSQQFLEGKMNREAFRDNIVRLEQNEDIQVSILLKDRKPLFVRENPQIQKWLRQVTDKNLALTQVTFTMHKDLDMFIAGVPLIVQDQIIGAIFLHQPVQEIEGWIAEINKIIAVSVLVLFIPLLVVSYFLSKRFAAPITSMSKTVKSISQGDFTKRVEVKGQDELVSLGFLLNNLTDKIAVVEESRRKFIGEISHELRTPLTTIRTTLQGILDGVIDPHDNQELLDISIEEIVRLNKLVDDLIDLSAFDERVVQLQKNDVSLTDLLSASIKQFELKAAEKNIIVEKWLEPRVFAFVDENRLKQVFANLLDNAIKHSKEGSKVTVGLSTKGKKSVIEFTNYGREIAEQDLHQIFDRFYKADKSRSEKGSGLGLTITQHIVTLHGGLIDVVSNKERTTFRVEL
ncbi:cell wall metabolism sensor histidine kinase WalK [Ammoniphilus sp. CFH 90114]|uniref:sensor histidine kinase n=1 Tax=Ammoniphilus sp. CFH 90114 TaxID=2493665 RepID=UPI0013E97D70|nr:ATP-binding protein [Ammoniphilus sp. CFH 90114]